MGALRYLTAGESHGPCEVGIVDGVPAGLPLAEADFAHDLAQRQAGYGRGARMQIERDQVQILSGVVNGRTIGSPLALRIDNRDWANWRDREVPPWSVPRPGHADLAGSLKYAQTDLRLIAERASARETAARVALGVVAKRLLSQFGIETASHVLSIGGAFANPPKLTLPQMRKRVDASPVRCADPQGDTAMREAIDEARTQGDSLGGTFEVIAEGVPPGLGSHVHWDRRLDGLLAQAMMSVPGIKGVEIGAGFVVASQPGTQVHDEVLPGLTRPTNRAGGTEGGISNGQPIVVRAAMKPIPTTITPIRSVDMSTGAATRTQYQRSDVCAVPAASVVGESMVALVLANAFLEKFGGDHIEETRRNYEGYLASIDKWWTKT
ncbi:MAG: chorismate synthase [Bacteroidetes bacterium]|nr:chorismate synthase [Bacteroidota bacterium]